MIPLVKYPLAKLLNDKEFKLEPYLKIDDQNPKNLNSNYNPREYQPWYLDLSLAEVVMWLYEKHGIWIEVRHIKTFNVNRFHVIIWNYKDTSDYITIHCENGVGYEVWDSLTEAYEASINYTLNNLI